MSRLFTLDRLPLAILATLFVFSGIVMAESTPEKNALVEELTTLSDSLHIVMIKAIADQDTLAVAGLVAPTTAAVMPGNITLKDGKRIVGNIRRLMQFVGGGNLTIKRKEVMSKGFNGREAGTYLIEKKMANEKVARWGGKYTIMYLKTDGEWIISSAFFVK